MRSSTLFLALLGVRSTFAAALVPRQVVNDPGAEGQPPGQPQGQPPGQPQGQPPGQPQDNSGEGTQFSFDDVIIVGDDGSHVVKQGADLSQFLDGVHLEDPEIANPPELEIVVEPNPERKQRKRSLLDRFFGKRGGDVMLFIELPPERFLGADIGMSAVTYANKVAATINMWSGQFVANGITVSQNVAITVVKDFLTSTTGVDYSHSTTSALSGSVTMSVPKNRWGCVVSNPMTFRRRGYIFMGQPGNGGSFVYYHADSYEDQTYQHGNGQLSWVKGVLTTCLGDGYPLPKCKGTGVLE